MTGRAAARTLVLIAAFGGGLTGCADERGTASQSARGAAPDRVFVGPQGTVGQFVVTCAPSHTAFDDPILFPGRRGASHLHQFFGNGEVDADSSYDSVKDSSTTCEQALDTASYWAPALFDEAGKVIDPTDVVAYYRAGPDVDPTTVRPYPEGLKMVAGDHVAITEQPTTVAGWTCAAGTGRSSTPPRCAARQQLQMRVTFPDCWDGDALDSDDHHGHVRYSHGGVCPGSHPMPIPQLELAVRYPPVPTRGLSLASGDVRTAHADFWNVWDQQKLTTEVRTCINRSLVCSLGPS